MKEFAILFLLAVIFVGVYGARLKLKAETAEIFDNPLGIWDLEDAEEDDDDDLLSWEIHILILLRMILAVL